MVCMVQNVLSFNIEVRFIYFDRMKCTFDSPVPYATLNWMTVSIAINCLQFAKYILQS